MANILVKKNILRYWIFICCLTVIMPKPGNCAEYTAGEVIYVDTSKNSYLALFSNKLYIEEYLRALAIDDKTGKIKELRDKGVLQIILGGPLSLRVLESTGNNVKVRILQGFGNFYGILDTGTETGPVDQKYGWSLKRDIEKIRLPETKIKKLKLAYSKGWRANWKISFEQFLLENQKSDAVIKEKSIQTINKKKEVVFSKEQKDQLDFKISKLLKEKKRLSVERDKFRDSYVKAKQESNEFKVLYERELVEKTLIKKEFDSEIEKSKKLENELEPIVSTKSEDSNIKPHFLIYKEKLFRCLTEHSYTDRSLDFNKKLSICIRFSIDDSGLPKQIMIKSVQPKIEDVHLIELLEKGLLNKIRADAPLDTLTVYGIPNANLTAWVIVENRRISFRNIEFEEIPN